jgi:sarcosine oxidase subunit alpha
LADDRITFLINGTLHEVREGVTVFAAFQLAGVTACRRSVAGEPRSGICGMGVCFECRVTIDGVNHQRACMVLCRPGMEIVTDA